MNENRDPREIQKRLADFFPASALGFKPQMIKGNRAMAVVFIDARDVIDRLNDVLGIGEWQDDYTFMPNGAVICHLRVRINGEWVTKTDVGGESEQPDQGDRQKSAVSDALKRAAVKLGVGRYLYAMPSNWFDYDQVKKQFVNPPTVPAQFLPASAKSAPKADPPKQASPPAGPATAQPPKQDAKTEAKGVETPKNTGLPSTGRELYDRLQSYDAKLAAQKLCKPGDLLAEVCKSGVTKGYPVNIHNWSGPAIQFAVDAVKAFEESVRNKESK
jgi:hypothetical protein